MSKLNKESEELLKEDDEDLPDELSNEEINSNLEVKDNVESQESQSEEFTGNEIDLEDEDDSFEVTEESSIEQALESSGSEEQSIEEQIREFNKNLIEASLYAAGRPLTIEELSNKLEFSKKDVEELINEVAFEYLDRSTALVIAQIGERYQMQIKPEYTEKVSKFAKGGAIAERYLRTLTVIALKQPILKSTIIKLRGTGAYEHIKYLIDNGFINADKKGRSHELTTTDKYADMFGLPKDKHQLKQAMISQLGIEEGQTINDTEDHLDQDKIE